MKRKPAIVLIVVGAVLTVLLALFFGGFGFWTIPGLAILAVGAAGLISGLLCARAARPALMSVGVYILLVGLGCLTGTLPHIMLGVAQYGSGLVMLAGLILTLIGLFLKRKERAPAAATQTVS